MGASGKLSAMKEDVKEARYPKKVRDLAKLEAKAVERGAYGDHNIDGLLQTGGARTSAVRDAAPSVQ